MPTAINPDSIRLFHITALENLPAVVAAGCLQAKNVLSLAKRSYTSIASESVQARRVKSVPVGPCGVIHDYVPFYFAPRSPMLFSINRGNTGFEPKQAGIVTLETTVSRAIAHTPNQFVLYDMNASLGYSTAYASLQDLDKVAWELLHESPTLDTFCAYWKSKSEPEHHAQRMEKRMAEFLVHQQVPLSAITRIGVADDTALEKLRLILSNSHLQSLIAVRRDWYY